MVVKHAEPFRWTGVPVRAYKEDGNLFKGVTRQVVSEGAGDLPFEVRYFEIEAGGHTTLERHEHPHVVYVTRGSGEVLIKDRVEEIEERDVAVVQGNDWHQFRATDGQALGFLCVVPRPRDRPVLPSERDLTLLRSIPGVAEFIRA